MSEGEIYGLCALTGAALYLTGWITGYEMGIRRMKNSGVPKARNPLPPPKPKR
jgi:curli biogenesis system outer membrane secretion channel CsgG